MTAQKSELIIITDLDGSLLDHHTYRWEAAQAALDAINAQSIPLILNSSKTAAELLSLREELHNTDPFIAENGAGILLPETCSQTLPESETLIRQNGFLHKTFGRPLQEVIATIQSLRSQTGVNFTGFSEMSPEQLQALTDLPRDGAERALQRHFTEPVFWQDSDAAWSDFQTQLAPLGISMQRGGRFTHFSGGGDKGQALLWLKEIYSSRRQTIVKTMALGDGENDLPMLRVADYPVIIRSPSNPLPDLAERQDAIITEAVGPAGWNQAVLDRIALLNN